MELDPDRRAINHRHQTRKELARGEDGLIACSQCNAVRQPRKACPNCGFLPRRPAECLNVIDGDLEQLDRNGKRQPMSYSAQERKSFYLGLKHLALERGNNPGAAAHRYREKFNEWPPRDWARYKNARQARRSRHGIGIAGFDTRRRWIARRRRSMASRDAPTKAARLLRRRNKPPAGQAWNWITDELIISDAWRSAPINTLRVVCQILLEQSAHAGRENGNLIVTWDDFVAYGINRKFVDKSIRDAVARGLIYRTQKGGMCSGGLRRPSRYGLGWLPNHVAAPAPNRWKAYRCGRGSHHPKYAEQYPTGVPGNRKLNGGKPPEWEGHSSSPGGCRDSGPRGYCCETNFETQKRNGESQ